MKKNFHSILMLASLIALGIVLHQALHAGTKPQKRAAVNEKLSLPSEGRAFPAVFFIGLE
jgi:hypothetical protein